MAFAFAFLDAAGFLRRVRVRANRDGVTVASGLIPSMTETSMSAAAIAQVFTRQFIDQESGPSYEVIARWRDGRLTTLVKRMPEAPQALYIERRIERALGLKDVPVPGEIPRSNQASG